MEDSIITKENVILVEFEESMKNERDKKRYAYVTSDSRFAELEVGSVIDVNTNTGKHKAKIVSKYKSDNFKRTPNTKEII